MLPTGLTFALGLCGAVLAAVACGLKEWSIVKTLTGTETHTGLWEWPSNTYCNGWLMATAAMIICTAIFFFLTMIAAILILISKVPWKTKPLRMGMFCLALLTFVCSILAICFYIAFHEWSPCWLAGSRNHVNTVYEYTRYGASFILACVACGLAMLMCLTAAWSVAKTPYAPHLDQMEHKEVSEIYEYPVPAAAPAAAYPTVYSAPAAYPAPAAAYPMAPMAPMAAPAYSSTGYGY